MAEIRYIIFELDEAVYGMDLAYVKEIEENYAIIPVPNAPSHIKGIINLRGDVVPVYSLRSRFNMPEANHKGKLILTYVHNMIIGFEVDRIHGIENIDDENRLPAPLMIVNEETTYIDCVLHASCGIVINISVENIVPESEADEINERLSKQQEEDNNG